MLSIETLQIRHGYSVVVVFISLSTDLSTDSGLALGCREISSNLGLVHGSCLLSRIVNAIVGTISKENLLEAKQTCAFVRIC